MGRLLELGRRYRCPPLHLVLRFNKTINECYRWAGTFHTATCEVSKAIVKGPHNWKLSVGDNYGASNILLTSTVRINRHRDNGSGVCTISQRRYLCNDFPVFTEARFCSGDLSVTTSDYSSTRRQFGDISSLPRSCGTIRHGTIRKFSSSGSPRQGGPRQDSKNENPSSNYLSQLLNLPLARLGRLNRPTGTMLLLWPCWWGTAIATPLGSFPDYSLLALFSIGALSMRTAGCIVNDMWDKDFDAMVKRTRFRPLASGEVSMAKAGIFLGGNLAVGLAVLLNLRPECWALRHFASVPIVIAYPLMKRVTWFPQAVLACAINWGVLVGWTAVEGSMLASPEAALFQAIPLYLGGAFWTMVYDTLYGHQDKLDDASIGLMSTSLWFGNSTKPALQGCTFASATLIALAGLSTGLSTPFYVGLAAASACLSIQVKNANLNDPVQLASTFSSTQYYGAIVAASIICGHF